MSLIQEDSNSSESKHETPWFYDSGWNWFTWNIFTWLFPLVCLQGTVANACSFYVIATNRKSFSYVTRQYLAIITFNDCLILTFKVSSHYLGIMSDYVKDNAWSWYTSPRRWGFASCVVYDFATFYCLAGAQFFQLGLTVDRLFAVAAPLKAKMILTHKRSWVLLGIIAAMALFLPILSVTNLTWDTDAGICVDKDENFFEFVYQLSELYFGRVFLCLSLIAGTFAICLMLAWNNRAALKMHSDTGLASSSNQLQQMNNQDRQSQLIRISVMLVFINFIFLTTTLPWNVTVIPSMSKLLSINIGETARMVVMTNFNTVVYLNNALCWPAYFMGSKFREAFGRLFFPGCLRPPVEHVS